MLEFLVLNKYPAERRFVIRKPYSKSVMDDFLQFLSKITSKKSSLAQSIPKYK